MGIVKLKNLPGLHLNDLLRRKKTSLSQFMNDFGISTYEGLKARCERIGVVAPSLEQFEKVMPKHVNSPTEGVVVLDPPPVVNERTGMIIESVEIAPTEADLFKKNKKKKVVVEEKNDLEVSNSVEIPLEADFFDESSIAMGEC